MIRIGREEKLDGFSCDARYKSAAWVHHLHSAVQVLHATCVYSNRLDFSRDLLIISYFSIQVQIIISQHSPIDVSTEQRTALLIHVSPNSGYESINKEGTVAPRVVVIIALPSVGVAMQAHLSACTVISILLPADLTAIKWV